MRPLLARQHRAAPKQHKPRARRRCKIARQLMANAAHAAADQVDALFARRKTPLGARQRLQRFDQTLVTAPGDDRRILPSLSASTRPSTFVASSRSTRLRPAFCGQPHLGQSSAQRIARRQRLPAALSGEQTHAIFHRTCMALARLNVASNTALAFCARLYAATDTAKRQAAARH